MQNMARLDFGAIAAQLAKKDELENNQLPTIDTPTAEYKDYFKRAYDYFKAYPERV